MKQNIYPKSVNNFQCLGPCYAKNVKTIHPTRFKMLDIPYSYCPVNQWQGVNPISGKEENMSFDKCINPTENKYTGIIKDILVPQTEFSKEYFLGVYYDIHSLDDGMNWLNNNINIFIDTKTRIINALLSVYGKDINIVDENLTNFVIEYIKTKEIKTLYNQFNSYIGIQDNEIYILNVLDNKLTNNEYMIERTNYLIKKFIDFETINKFLIKYCKDKKKNWDNINNYLDDIINELLIYITKKIKLTLSIK